MTTSCFDREDETFIVLINHEGQYSIWPHWKDVPGGWTAVEGVRGDRKTVSEYVDAHWSDMRPRSLQQAMAHAQEQAAPAQLQSASVEA